MSQRQRRSARTGTIAPASSEPPAAPSSTSSTSLTRAERNTRMAKRTQTQSPRGSVSQSREREQVEDLEMELGQGRDEEKDEEKGKDIQLQQQQPRRSRRGTEIEKDVEGGGDGDVEIDAKREDDDEEEAEEEVTRCICAHPEYPGPPPWVRERERAAALGMGMVLGGVDETVSDDLGNFFVQCDNCQVWQHGGCMGLTDESMLPEQYYCELCRPESHRLVVERNGSKSSQYLPVLEARSSRSSSLSASEPTRKNDKRQLSEASLSNAKRRATMNSRTALDDDELLRQAIEESKEMGTLGKRTRDESEEYADCMRIPASQSQLTEYSNRHVSKRQRTNSSSAPDPPKRSRSLSEGGSENGMGVSGKDSKRIRGAAARNQREKELREKLKEKELAATQRAEAARKREARSERRRGEDSPPPTPTFSPSKPVQPSNNNKDTPPPPKPNINNLRNTHKGAARSHAARRGRLGRNQYTRDRELTNGNANGDASDTPGREESHEESPNGINGESGRSSKAKTHGARTSMNEMKRRVAAILEFVGRMQGEGLSQGQGQGVNSRSSEGSGGTPNGSGNGNSGSMGLSTTAASLVQAVELAIGKGVGMVVEELGSGNGSLNVTGKEFRDMGSGEMMEVLTRELIGWQNAFGRYGEK